MKYLLLQVSLLLSFYFHAQETPMSSSEIALFKTKVQQEMQSISSLQFDFVQTKHLSFLKNDVISKGKMYYNSNRMFKWEYNSPSLYSILFKSNAIYINDNGKKSAVSKNNELFQRLNTLVQQSISGQVFNNKDFTVSFTKNKLENTAQFTPKNASLKKYIKNVKLYFNHGEQLASKVKITEPSGDYTLLHFSNKRKNISIPLSVFNN